MSKRKDRLYTHYRVCPICAGKNISVLKSKRIFQKEKTYIQCHKCCKDIQVKEKRKI